MFQNGKLLPKTRTLALFLLLSPLFLWGVRIEFIQVSSHSIPTQQTSTKKSYYQLTSKFYVEDFQKKNYKSFLLNRKNYMLKNNYYLDGFLKTEVSYLSFKKAYILGGKIHLFMVIGHINNSNIEAKEVIYDEYKTYQLLKCEVRKSTSILRRKKYKIKEM